VLTALLIIIAALVVLLVAPLVIFYGARVMRCIGYRAIRE